MVRGVCTPFITYRQDRAVGLIFEWQLVKGRSRKKRSAAVEKGRQWQWQRGKERRNGDDRERSFAGRTSRVWSRVVARRKRKRDTMAREALAHTRTRRRKELRDSRRRRPVSPIELRGLVDGGAAEGRRASPCGMRHNATAFDRPPFFFLKRVTNPLKTFHPKRCFPIGAQDRTIFERKKKKKKEKIVIR